VAVFSLVWPRATGRQISFVFAVFSGKIQPFGLVFDTTIRDLITVKGELLIKFFVIGLKEE
jgi:hypothetical protein